MTKDGCNCHRKVGPGECLTVEQLEELYVPQNACYEDLVPDKTNPAHYSIGDEQVWDFIARKKLDYFEGNVVKYVCRSPYKGEQIQDLKKAIAYLQKKIELVEAQSLP